MVDLNKLLSVAVDENASSFERLEAKRTLRQHGYSEILDKKVAEHVTHMQNQIRAEFTARDPVRGAETFDEVLNVLGSLATDLGIAPTPG